MPSNPLIVGSLFKGGQKTHALSNRHNDPVETISASHARSHGPFGGQRRPQPRPRTRACQLPVSFTLVFWMGRK